MRAHDGARPEELLATHLVERRPGVLQHVKLVEHGLGVGQHRRHDVAIRAVHIQADGLHRGALPRVQAVGQQRAQTLFAAIRLQPHHLAMHQVGEDRPESLALSAVDLIDPQMPGPVFRARPIPGVEKGALSAPGGAPAHVVADGGMTGGHRLTVQADPLPKAASQPGMRVRKADPLAANATVPTPEPPQPIPQGHGMLSPGQVIPRPRLRVAHATRATSAPRADIAQSPAARAR